jgi:acetolactate synthase-1/2/3 large subunit
MRVIDAIMEILKREGVEFLSCYPTTPLIDAAAEADLMPIICRQERVGVGIADGYTRVANGKRIGVFAMQYGPGAENAFSGVATAFNDAVPVLVLPTGAPTERVGLVPYFDSVRGYAPVAKWTERINLRNRVPEIMRRAFSLLRMGRRGPVLLEVPADIATQEVEPFEYQPVRTTCAAGNPRDIEEAVKALIEAKSPLLHVGQGVHYAEAWDELRELAELLQAPVMTTLLGKSAFPEDHPLSVGVGYRILPKPAAHFLNKADLVFGIGCSFSRHHQSRQIPDGKTTIHLTNAEVDLNKSYTTRYPILGDAKLTLAQFIEAVKERLGKEGRRGSHGTADEIKRVKDEWLREWMPKLTSDEVPMTPYRVIWELMHVIDPAQAMVTHDSGGPRDQLAPFYRATVPHSYLGWGKSHGLGTGLGLIMGAKLAQPEKIAVHYMGDAAFGMVGLDFETAARHRIPIIAMVMNNSTMAVEVPHMVASHEKYRARDIGGDYADMGRAMGGYAERVEKPVDIAPAIQRAVKMTREEGRPVLLEFITSVETAVANTA